LFLEAPYGKAVDPVKHSISKSKTPRSIIIAIRCRE
jgi:hypothetical protein